MGNHFVELCKIRTNGVADFNYFFPKTLKVNRIIKKVIKALSSMIYCLFFIFHVTFKRH